MKNIHIPVLTSLVVFLSMAFTMEVPFEKDYTECLKKIGSEWGEQCPDCKVYKDSYRVKLKNECTDSLDVMICVQESDKTWKRFMFHAMAPNDSMVAYACEGTGKYLKWAKKAGDKSVAFPSVDEVNQQYKN